MTTAMTDEKAELLLSLDPRAAAEMPELVELVRAIRTECHRGDEPRANPALAGLFADGDLAQTQRASRRMVAWPERARIAAAGGMTVLLIGVAGAANALPGPVQRLFDTVVPGRTARQEPAPRRVEPNGTPRRGPSPPASTAPTADGAPSASTSAGSGTSVDSTPTHHSAASPSPGAGGGAGSPGPKPHHGPVGQPAPEDESDDPPSPAPSPTGSDDETDEPAPDPEATPSEHEGDDDESEPPESDSSESNHGHDSEGSGGSGGSGDSDDSDQPGGSGDPLRG